MTAIQQHIASIRSTLPEGVTLISVSKFNPISAIQEAYDAGERDFGESHVQELIPKYEALPKDIRWHMIGHLQTNKVKQIVPFVHLIQSVDSIHLMEVIQKEAAKIGRTVNILLEVHVAHEEAKSGFLPEELPDALEALKRMPNIHLSGLMTMATNTDDENEIRRCFRKAKELMASCHLSTPDYQLSIGMSSDYLLAIEEGSTMVRIGSIIFGERHYL